jgi:hypothetical protein
VYWQGRRYYLGKFDLPESRERYARFVGELAVVPSDPAPPATTDPGLTIVELCAAYWDFAERYYVKNGRPTDHVWIVKRAIGVVRDLYASNPWCSAFQALYCSLRQRAGLPTAPTGRCSG